MRMGSRFSMFAALCSAATLAVSACGKDEPKPPPPTTAATVASAEADAGTQGKGQENEQPRRDPEPAAAPTPAGAPTGAFAAPFLSMLPKGTLGVFVGTPKKVIDGLGLEALIAAYGEQLAPVRAEMMENLGKDFLDLATWKAVGIDVDGPAGVASHDATREGMVVFATLADPAAFRAFLDELAKKAGATPTEEKVGEASILSMGERDRAALVLKGNLVAIVGIERGSGAVGLAKAMLEVTPEASLAGDADFRAAVSGVASDEAGAYAHIGTFVKLMMRAPGSMKLATDLDRQLAEARAANDAAAVARLEQELADHNRWVAEAEARMKAEYDMMQSVVGDLAGLALGFDITAESVEASFRLPLGAESALKKLVANTSGVFPIVKATNQSPMFLASMRLDLPAYMALVEKMLKADGVDLAEVKSQMKEFVGVDLDKDVLSLFDGEFGFVATGDIKAMMSSDDAPWNRIGGGFVVGLSNPEGMKALLGKVGGLEQLARAVRWDAATGVMSVPLPIDMTLTIQVAGKHLVVSPDAELGKRIAANDGAGSFVGSVANARLKALLETPDQAAVFVMPQMLGAGWMLIAKGSEYHWVLPPPTDNMLTPKYQEYLKLKNEIEVESEAREAKGMEQMMAVLDKVGHTAEVISVKADGIVGTIGQYLNGGTVPEVLKSIVELQQLSEGEDAGRREKLERLWKLEAELQSNAKPVEPDTVEPVPAPKPETP